MTPEQIGQDCIVDVRGHLRGGRYCGDKKGGERKEQCDEETDSARNHLWEIRNAPLIRTKSQYDRYKDHLDSQLTSLYQSPVFF